jgi:hypothetical protein
MGLSFEGLQQSFNSPVATDVGPLRPTMGDSTQPGKEAMATRGSGGRVLPTAPTGHRSSRCRIPSPPASGHRWQS